MERGWVKERKEEGHVSDAWLTECVRKGEEEERKRA